MNLLEDNNQELYLHCKVSNIISTKVLANKIIELIEDADGYHWNYNYLYEGKNNITYWYFCSQWDIFASKPHKHPDLSKQQDTLSMEGFACDVTIKISIDKTTKISKVELCHKALHVKLVDKSVSQFTKHERFYKSQQWYQWKH